MHNTASSPTSAAAATMHKIVQSFDSAAISSPTSPSMPSAFGDHHFRPLAFPAVDAQGSMLSALYAAAMTPFLTTACDGSPLLTGAAGTNGYGHAATTLSMSPMALESVIASKKSTTKKTANRSLWKCRRRRLSMKDLLSSPTPPSHQRAHSSKASARRQCGIPECTKYALSGGFCISHGGGKLCRQQYCQTVAQSGGLCKAHGGGSKCKAPDCGSVARRQGLCMAHGGRQACKIDGCNKCAHGGGLCIAHGGGKRCSFDDCPKSAQAGGLCYSHGGGKRCAAPECFQAARKGGRCIRHRDDAAKVVPAAHTLSKFPSGFYEPKNPFRNVCDVAQHPYEQYVRSPPLPSQDDEPVEHWWPGGLTGHGHRHHPHYRQVASASEELLLSSWAANAAPLEQEEVYVSKKYACENQEKEQDKKTKKKESGEKREEYDCENVQELSDLFTSIENENSGDGCAIDFSVLLEGEHAFNVEEVSEIFSDLEDVATTLPSDAHDAEIVDEMAALFESLEQAQQQQQDEELITSVAADTDSESESESEVAQDAENVDELSHLFSALEEQVAVDEKEAHEDWIASLDVDHVSGLFSELEQLQRVEEVKTPATASVAPAPAPTTVDSRIFVPSFAVRIEGRRAPVAMSLPRVAAGTAFLAGPPCLMRAGPPLLSSDKRKHAAVATSTATSSPVSPPTDPFISETRRASAAKRRRVNGRFVREQNAFVSITQLQ